MNLLNDLVSLEESLPNSERKYKICLDPHSYKTKPSSKLDVSVGAGDVMISQVMMLSSRIVNHVREVTQQELEAKIGKGHSFTMGTFDIDPYTGRIKRKIDLLEQLSIITVDFDSGDYTLKDLISYDIFGTIYETFSHTMEHPKYRGILYLEKPITKTENAIKVVKSVYEKLPRADSACSDVTRINYGGQRVVYSIDRVITLNEVDHLIKSYKGEVKWKKGGNLPQSDFPPMDSLEQKSILFSLSDPSRKYITTALQNISASVLQYNGDNRSRYQILWSAAMRIGKLSIIAPNIAEGILLQAVENNSLYADWDKDPQFVIQSGYNWGRGVIDFDLVRSLQLDEAIKQIEEGTNND